MTYCRLFLNALMHGYFSGNILINVGPTKEGTIPIILQERLLQMGEWLGINGEAIYTTVPWTVQNDTLTSDVWFVNELTNQ